MSIYDSLISVELINFFLDTTEEVQVSSVIEKKYLLSCVMVVIH